MDRVKLKYTKQLMSTSRSFANTHNLFYCHKQISSFEYNKRPSHVLYDTQINDEYDLTGKIHLQNNTISIYNESILKTYFN